jgi:hypothetical protein
VQRFRIIYFFDAFVSGLSRYLNCYRDAASSIADLMRKGTIPSGYCELLWAEYSGLDLQHGWEATMGLQLRVAYLRDGLQESMRS